MPDQHITSASKNGLIFSSKQVFSPLALPVLGNNAPENTCKSSKPLPSLGPYVQAVLGIWGPSSLLTHVFVALCFIEALPLSVLAKATFPNRSLS